MGRCVAVKMNWRFILKLGAWGFVHILYIYILLLSICDLRLLLKFFQFDFNPTCVKDKGLRHGCRWYFCGSVIAWSAHKKQNHPTNFLGKKWRWNENNHYCGKTGQKTHQWEFDAITSVDALNALNKSWRATCSCTLTLMLNHFIKFHVNDIVQDCRMNYRGLQVSQSKWCSFLSPVFLG